MGSPYDATLQSAILELSGDAFLLLDADGSVRAFNAAAERLFGHRAAEVIGRPVEEILPGLPSAHSLRTPCVLEARRKDGGLVAVELQAVRAAESDSPALVLVARPTRPARRIEQERDPQHSQAALMGRFGYWDRDLVTGTVTCSADTLRILGLPADAPSNDPNWFKNLVHPEDRDALERVLESALTRLERFDVTHRIVRPDGLELTVRSVAEFRSDKNGKPIALLGVVHDITEIVRADAALRESQRTLKAIVDSTTAVIYIKDIEGRYILVNRRFEDLFHVLDETARGKSDLEVFPKKAAEAFRANDLRVLREGAPIEFEEIAPHDDGLHTYISIKFPLQRASGEIYAVCGISTDITARKHAEEELNATRRSLERLVDDRTADLKESNLKLQAEVAEREDAVGQLQRLIETANEGIWIIDASSRTTFANPRMAEILGTTTEDMLGRSIFEFIDQQHLPMVEESLQRRWRGVAEQLDFQYRRKDGSHIWTHLSTNPIRDRHGTVVGALAMVADISERKRAESSQQLLLRELDHRVKNTLATVVALADLTMERSRSLVEFGLSFSGRVQALARAHEALARARWQDVSFDEVVTVVLAPLASGEAARVVAEGDGVRVSARTMTPLALALNELATNALKHGALSGPGGHVRIRWGLSKEGAFSLVWTEEGATLLGRPSEQGTGLTLIRGLIEHELEGELAVEFAAEGLKCRITLPARGREVDYWATAADSSKQRSLAPPPATAEGLAGVRAIVVEDNFAVASSLAWLLQSYGCEVVGTAGSVAAGCKLVDDVEFDVAVLDISLGDTDVAEVARRIQARNKRIIYLTGYVGTEQLPAELRAHPCLAKPVQATELVDAMRGVAC